MRWPCGPELKTPQWSRFRHREILILRLDNWLDGLRVGCPLWYVGELWRGEEEGA